MVAEVQSKVEVQRLKRAQRSRGTKVGEERSRRNEVSLFVAADEEDYCRQCHEVAPVRIDQQQYNNVTYLARENEHWSNDTLPRKG